MTDSVEKVGPERVPGAGGTSKAGEEQKPIFKEGELDQKSKIEDVKRDRKVLIAYHRYLRGEKPQV